MRIKSFIIAICSNVFFILSIFGDEQYLIAHFPMDVSGVQTKELVTGNSFTIQNNFGRPENIPGAEGMALRCDGFSTFVNAQINTASASNLSEFSASLWCAIETYPMMAIDVYNTDMTYIAGNMNEDAKTGFAFVLNSVGTFGFEMYINGSKKRCYATLEKFPKYEWANLTVTIKNGSISLYKNAILVGRTTFPSAPFAIGGRDFIIGKSFSNPMSGIFRLNVINGLIDDIRIYSKALSSSELSAVQPQNTADLSIPKSRHESDIQYPSFHGRPATNWTNEPHGLVFYNNKYHVFFQKNANGPYMARLHWGHISSPDLCNWKEEKIAIAPGESYDQKGAWSGCVFSDEAFSDGKLTIFYTSVDYAKASISEASPLDDSLVIWQKNTSNPVVAGRPSGLSDDFRDPYLFKSGENVYMIVGTSKDGCGATTLHRYDKNLKTWSNDGSIFYKGASTEYGTFWEMPAIIPMGGGRWLFLVTNLGASTGTETLYWVGSINSDGTFTAYNPIPKKIELFSGNGYGLLSPSILQKDGKTIALGIVPDKLPSEVNLRLGWAHLYSLPREWTLDLSNTLIQKPYEGLKNMRSTEQKLQLANTTVNSGTTPVDAVKGKSIEIEAQFVISSAQKIGFTVRKSSIAGVQVYYNRITNKVVVDASNVSRLWNDAGLYNGVYEASLPELHAVGETMKMQLFVDHSIMDIFINDKYAFSLRVFPTDQNSDNIEIFSEGGATIFNYLNIWSLSPENATTSSINEGNIADEQGVKLYAAQKKIYYSNIPSKARISVYDSVGRKIVSTTPQNIDGCIELSVSGLVVVKVEEQNVRLTKKLILN